MAPKRISIEVCSNPEYRVFHVTAQVSSERVKGGLLGGNRRDPFNVIYLYGRTKEYSDDTKATIMRFYDIDGIESIDMTVNDLTVARSLAYNWDELEADIIDAIKTTVNWQNEEVEVDYLFMGKRYAEPVPDDVYKAEMEYQRRRDNARMIGFLH